MAVFVSAVGFGVVTAAILAISAVGFTLQFSVTNVFNLAFGSVMTLSGFVAYWLNAAGLNVWVAMAAAALSGGLISLAINEVIYTPFIRHGLNLFGMVIVTISVAVIFDHGLQAAVGPTFFSYVAPAGRAFHFADFVLTRQELIIIGIALVLTILVQVGLQYTRVGKAMRGLAVNASLARACGIPTRQVIALAWFVSGVLAGIGGVALFLDTSTFTATTGSEFLIVIIAAAVLGGIGSPRGAVLGALVVGIVTEVGAAYWNPELKDVLAFGVLIAVLLVRPQGLFSRLATERAITR
ncbi:MAG TPA: branched-chain amino acid ABC transporter permease [Solirubrobacteraceae bacterium]|nr:branched-chain amino acid ABC transporter permease [Solirubrobacteraceae bacterium]